MDYEDRIRLLDTTEKCAIFARNAAERGREDLAKKANQRALEIRAESHNARSKAEKEALQAVYAYEEVLTKRNGRTTRATRTWQMIARHGIIESVERAVNRPSETQGYRALAEMGLENFAFEAVVLRYPELFSKEAVETSESRMSEWKSA